MTGPRVAVTGATGFLGRSVVPALVAEGAEVAALSRSEARAAVFHSLEGVEVLRFTAAADAADALAGWSPDVVVHLATLFVARHGDARDAIEMVRANVEFGASVLEGCRAASASLVSTSSIWQHFEGLDYAPVSLYAATKQGFDDLASYYARFEGMTWTRLILGDTYGPGDDRGKLLSALLSAAATRRPLPMSSGAQLWDPVHARDVASAVARLSLDQSKNRGGSWQLTSGEAAPVKSYVARISRAIGTSIPVLWGARPDRGREMTHPWLVGDWPPGWRPSADFDCSVRGIWRDEFEAAEH